MKDSNVYISYKKLISHIDIKEGDIVSVSSDILPLLNVCRENGEVFNSNRFIDTIIKRIGNKGTLLFPIYNWGFCKGVAFDYYNTLSQVGAINNEVLKRKDFKRTKHPIYSFAVWGKDQDYLCKMDNISAWGSDSPFAYLYENYAKNLCIGVDYKNSVSFLHYPEEKVGVDYRYMKDFTASYIDKKGNRSIKTYQMYVRDFDLNVETALSPQLDDVLLNMGYYIKYSINGICFSLVELHGFADVLERDIRIKGGLIYPKKVTHNVQEYDMRTKNYNNIPKQ